MIHEAIATGATIEEAQENARKALNAPESADVRTEILAMPTKKVLGLFGGSPAKARAYYETPDAPAPKKDKAGNAMYNKNGEPIMTKASSAACYCWFIWQKGYKGDTIVRWFN
jgi:spoIIIJ-associated protein